MKFARGRGSGYSSMSPSVWREWIEICGFRNRQHKQGRSPSVWREWIEIKQRSYVHVSAMSPSVWREWIEILMYRGCDDVCEVSLRVEGVD